MEDSAADYLRPSKPAQPLNIDARPRDLTGDEIVARRAQARQDRENHERHWLAIEAEKYALKRPAKPISLMPA